MTEDDKRLIAEMEAGLEGVTPGPWEVEYGEIGNGPDSHAYALLRCAEDESYTGVETGEVHSISGSPIMEHIARCSPDNIRTLLSLIRSAEERAEKADTWGAAREALLELNAGDPLIRERVNALSEAEDALMKAVRSARAALDTTDANSRASSILTSSRNAVGDSNDA